MFFEIKRLTRIVNELNGLKLKLAKKQMFSKLLKTNLTFGKVKAILNE